MTAAAFAVFDTLGARRMNLYVVFAIALGAISGVVEAPVCRPVLSTLAAPRDNRVHRQPVRASLPGARVPQTLMSAGMDRNVCATQRCDAPLTGAATPRAPALG
jgi:hypothetical protein